jgi:DNA-binding NtrC family response regulator
VKIVPSKILVVDDEPEVGWLFGRVLGEEGYEVLTAETSEEALAQIEKEQPDVVFLDVKLSGQDGIALLRNIQRSRSKQVVIMLTGHGEVSTAVEAMKLGAYDYLIKPLPNDRLKIIVKHALQTVGLRREVNGLKKQVSKRWTWDRFIGASPQMQKVFELVRKVATHDVTVLVRGESGTGKELVARAIHADSHRRDQPFVPLDCATLPEALVESEIFGYEKGAFTGALDRKPGRFERANEGTLFLDEVGNLASHVQMKLLRVLQEGEVERLGSKESLSVDVRLIAATNMDLEDLMKRGTFRDDLFHRLNVFVICLPPLREREGDLELLSRFFLERFNRELDRSVQGISDEAIALMHRYDWPGNVRELQNALKSAVILAEDWVLPQHLPAQLIHVAREHRTQSETSGTSKQDSDFPAGQPAFRAGASQATSIKQVAKEAERELIVRTLWNCHWNKAQAARRLGVDYKTLYNKIKIYRIIRDHGS